MQTQKLLAAGEQFLGESWFAAEDIDRGEVMTEERFCYHQVFGSSHSQLLSYFSLSYEWIHLAFLPKAAQIASLRFTYRRAKTNRVAYYGHWRDFSSLSHKHNLILFFLRTGTGITHWKKLKSFCILNSKFLINQWTLLLLSHRYKLLIQIIFLYFRALKL